MAHALAHPAWGHRKIWAMVRHDGHLVSATTVLWPLREEGLVLPAEYQRERRKAAFAVEPGQNGSRDRGFGTLKYEWLYIDEIDDALMLANHAEEYR